MYDEYSAPIDSYDLYAMGLRAPRCNGCKYAELKWQLGDKFLRIGNSVYELDAEPTLGQGEPMEYEGRSIRFHAYFISTEHSDECWHFTPPSHAYTKHVPGETWKTREGEVIPISELETRHLINILNYIKRRKGEKTAKHLAKSHIAIIAIKCEALGRKVQLSANCKRDVWHLVFPTLWQQLGDKIREVF